MSVETLTILYYPHPKLRQLCQPVDAVDAGVRRLMSQMLETMYQAEGIGLAASQVGAMQRVLVMDLGRGEASRPILMANPEIVWRDPEATFTYPEGCLSIPGQYADITRPQRVTVRYLDENNQAAELTAADLLSSCIQHEIDHLNGVLFVDHLSALKRKMLLKKYEKEQPTNPQAL